MPQLPVVNVGVIGLGADWQSRYLPSLQKMKQRLRVVAVHDDVAIRAMAGAEQLGAQPVLGIRELLERTDVRAYLLLGAAWRTEWMVHQLAERSLPVFLGRDIRLTTDEIRSWQRQSEESGITVVPEFPLRFQPAILRLHELIATQLGPITCLGARILPENNGHWAMASLTHILDCCGSLLKRHQTNVELIINDPEGAPPHVRLTYEERRDTEGRSAAVAADMTVVLPDDSQMPVTTHPLMELSFSDGTAVIQSPTELHWSVDGHSEVETLDNDRSATEVMLDLFARRVVGGLIPAPDLNDLLRAIDDADAVRHLLSGTPAMGGH